MSSSRRLEGSARLGNQERILSWAFNCAEVYIMKIVVNGEYEEFLPADEDKMEALSKIVEERFEAMEDEDDEDDEDEGEEEKK